MSPKGPRVAFVTGAAQGIGRGISLRLADDGYDVAINDLQSNLSNLESLAKEIGDKGRRTYIVIADVAIDAQVKHMVQEVAEKLGSLDIMVANAGILSLKPLIETSVEEFDRIYSVNVRGPMLCYKYAAIQMIAQGHGGRIIGASSTAGRRGAIGFSGYCASKFAVRGLTQVAALELGKHGITVNAYAPGFTDTDMTRTIDLERARAGGFAPGEYSKNTIATFPIPRAGKPEDIANLVSFFASEQASYITGQTYDCNGGTFFS